MLFLDVNSPMVIQQSSSHTAVDIDRDEMRILGSDVDGFSPDGKKLVQEFLYSPEAIDFMQVILKTPLNPSW